MPTDWEAECGNKPVIPADYAPGKCYSVLYDNTCVRVGTCSAINEGPGV